MHLEKLEEHARRTGDVGVRVELAQLVLGRVGADAERARVRAHRVHLAVRVEVDRAHGLRVQQLVEGQEARLLAGHANRVVVVHVGRRGRARARLQVDEGARVGPLRVQVDRLRVRLVAEDAPQLLVGGRQAGRLPVGRVIHVEPVRAAVVGGRGCAPARRRKQARRVGRVQRAHARPADGRALVVGVVGGSRAPVVGLIQQVRLGLGLAELLAALGVGGRPAGQRRVAVHGTVGVVELVGGGGGAHAARLSHHRRVAPRQAQVQRARRRRALVSGAQVGAAQARRGPGRARQVGHGAGARVADQRARLVRRASAVLPPHVEGGSGGHSTSCRLLALVVGERVAALAELNLC